MTFRYSIIAIVLRGLKREPLAPWLTPFFLETWNVNQPINGTGEPLSWQCCTTYTFFSQSHIITPITCRALSLLFHYDSITGNVRLRRSWSAVFASICRSFSCNNKLYVRTVAKSIFFVGLSLKEHRPYHHLLDNHLFLVVMMRMMRWWPSHLMNATSASSCGATSAPCTLLIDFFDSTTK